MRQQSGCYSPDRRVVHLPSWSVTAWVGTSLADGGKSAVASVETRRASYVKAYDEARAAGDHEQMAAAALRLAGLQMYGTFPGRLPAFMHEAYAVAQGRQRVMLAVEIARVWAYGGQANRAAQFAAEALAAPETAADPELLAHVLDAQLLIRWGPDDLDERLRITAQLEDTVAHLSDAEVRMSAHLWRLTTALECLDVPAARRQLRALQSLADETGLARVRFFAESRRAMHALLVGDADAAERAMVAALTAGAEADEPDLLPIEHTLTSAIARQRGDLEAVAEEAAGYEEFAIREGYASVGAEAAQMWAFAGDMNRATRLLHELAGADFGQIARDADWMLTMTALTETAAAVGATALTEQAATLLEPYAGRGVVNGGAVGFAGVVDHYLALACASLGRFDDAARWFGSAIAAYERVGAMWWQHQCALAMSDGPMAPVASGTMHFRPATLGLWEVGRAGGVSTIREMKGLRYLQLLLAAPGVDIPALDLSDAVAGHPGAGVVGPTRIEQLDRRSLLTFRRRLAEIDVEIDEVQAWGDEGRLARLEDERVALLEELRAATGLGGRPRAASGAEERARVAVRKAIAAAVTRVGLVDPALGRLLTDTVVTGAVCRYEPDPHRPVTWLLS